MNEPEDNTLRDVARLLLGDPSFEVPKIHPDAPLVASLDVLATHYTLCAIVTDLNVAFTSMHARCAVDLRSLVGPQRPVTVGPFIFRFEPLAVVCSVKGREVYDLNPKVIESMHTMRAHERGQCAAQQFLDTALDRRPEHN